jgi:hypothetical protein
MKRLLVTLALATLVACGGDSATAPEPAFPSVVGVYSINGTFAGGVLPFQGTITIVQPSRDQPTLSGSCAVSVQLESETANFTEIDAASVSQSGLVSFNIGSASGPTTWRFSGTLNGTTIVGTHTLTDGTDSFIGTFTAVRQ